MTLEKLVQQFRRNGQAYLDQGNVPESRGWFSAADLLEEFLERR